MILSFLIYDSFFFSDLWFLPSLSLSMCVCVRICICFLSSLLIYDSFFSDIWFFLLFWSMILWNLNGSDLIGTNRSFKFRCCFLVWNPVDLAFIFWSFLFGYWENEEEGSLFLIWNPKENEAIGDLKPWVLAVQEKKEEGKKKKFEAVG